MIGVTWTDAGSCMKPLARWRTSSENVAENSRFWRLAGMTSRTRADVADEAHVEHAIGLVEDEDLDARQVDRALGDVVEEPAGVATTMSGPKRRARICAGYPTPP